MIPTALQRLRRGAVRVRRGLAAEVFVTVGKHRNEEEEAGQEVADHEDVEEELHGVDERRVDLPLRGDTVDQPSEPQQPEHLEQPHHADVHAGDLLVDVVLRGGRGRLEDHIPVQRRHEIDHEPTAQVVLDDHALVHDHLVPAVKPGPEVDHDVQVEEHIHADLPGRHRWLVRLECEPVRPGDGCGGRTQSVSDARGNQAVVGIACALAAIHDKAEDPDIPEQAVAVVWADRSQQHPLQWRPVLLVHKTRVPVAPEGVEDERRVVSVFGLDFAPRAAVGVVAEAASDARAALFGMRVDHGEDRVLYGRRRHTELTDHTPLSRERSHRPAADTSLRGGLEVAP